MSWSKKIRCKNCGKITRLTPEYCKKCGVQLAIPIPNHLGGGCMKTEYTEIIIAKFGFKGWKVKE